ncbi:MAG: tetratricopeptide repeat protein [Spirochaetaceae bacterium]|nr:tetratricopeptide repeat protein [Spirochaetaceae bacterium]
MANFIKCPNCGELGQEVGTKCKACDYPVTLTEMKTVMAMPMPQVNKYIASYREQMAADPNSKPLNGSIAMCYLRLKMYDKALPCFEKAMEENFEDSTPFFYAAVCILKGQKAFVHNRQEIDKILEYINAAKMIEAKPIYEYFEAYVRYDYFGRKFMKVPPAWQEVLQQSKDSGISDEEIALFYQTIGVERPSCL